MSSFALLAIAYVSLVVFAAVAAFRSIKIARLPVHLRWELAPVPHEKGKGHYGGSYFEEYEWWTKPREKSLVNEAVYMFLEIVFLKGVWENNRRLWWFSFPLHFGMYLLIVAAVVLLLESALQLCGVPSAAILRAAIPPVAAVGYALGALGAIGLLCSRLFDPRFRPFRTPMSLLNLGFLVAVFISGGATLVALGDFSGQLSGFVQAMFTANVAHEIPGVLAAHLVLVFLFLAYLPFTQMLHFVAKYFTYHQVRWDDKPMVPGSKMEKQVEKLLQQPVTWSAAHLKADGKKNWVDIVTDDEVEE